MTNWQPLAEISALRARAGMLHTLRQFFSERDVLEVHTPLLGADTVTDVDVESIAVPGYGFLQTSPEYFLKRLLAAGVPDCYQLAQVFRHDERGRYHNPEFTLLEWYRLGFDQHRLMAELRTLVDEILGPADWRTVTYAELAGDIQRPRADLDLDFANACGELDGRWFVMDYPADQAALARVVESSTGPVAARFELVIDGLEIANGYWELLDAQTHRQRFDADNVTRQQRGLPTRVVDDAFMQALESGLPACAGVALGVERLLMLLTGAERIEEVLTFR